MQHHVSSLVGRSLLFGLLARCHCVLYVLGRCASRCESAAKRIDAQIQMLSVWSRDASLENRGEEGATQAEDSRRTRVLSHVLKLDSSKDVVEVIKCFIASEQQ